ncbi:MAG: hypothetical protein KC493_06510 [Bacteriovoracaceae bacterium]|nr:hypothetical protein [Bacteriovoracaceae bacterium]
MLKILLIHILIICSLQARGDVKEWLIVEEKGEHWLKHKEEKGIKSLITKRTGKSKIIETRALGKKHELIIYFTGMAGTFKLVDIYYAIIYDKSKKKFLGDYPWKYKGHNNSKMRLPQPKWDIKADHIIITDEQTDLKKTINLN